MIHGFYFRQTTIINASRAHAECRQPRLESDLSVNRSRHVGWGGAAWRRLALANWQREAAWQHSDGGVLPGHWQSGGRSRVGAVQMPGVQCLQVQVQMPGVQKPEARLVALSSSKLLSECEVAVEGWLQAICKYLGTTNTPEIRCAAAYRPHPAL